MAGEQRDRNDAAHEKGPSERVDNLHNAKRGRGSTSMMHRHNYIGENSARRGFRTYVCSLKRNIQGLATV